MNWLDFEKQEKGYKHFDFTRENIKANIGKRICYLRNCDINSRRCMVFTQYATIQKLVRNQVIFTNYDSVNIKDVVECGIKIENPELHVL